MKGINKRHIAILGMMTAIASSNLSQHETPKRAVAPPERKLTRNQLCPCGSRVKYKRCCMPDGER